MAAKSSVLRNWTIPTTGNIQTSVRKKLWIFDCVRMPVHSENKESYSFKGMKIKEVDVVGVVVGVKKSGTSFTGYIVDDGTGAITVMFYHQREKVIRKKTDIKSLRSQVAETPGFSSQEHKILDHMMGQVLRVHEEVLELRKIGDTVHVIGKLRDYRNEREINATHLSVVDINYEASRIFDMIEIYDNYNKDIKK